MKKAISAILLLAMMCSLLACGNNSGQTASSSSKKEASSSVKGHEGEVRSFLTGQWVPEAVNEKRPLAVMLSNQPEAPNQSGIGDASIVYEVPGESNYATRFMGIFEDWNNIKKMGSVRSCRTYYVYFMLEYDSIYVHAGQAKFALPYLALEQVDDLNSVFGTDSAAFFNIEEEGRAQEHTLFTSGEKSLDLIKEKGYDLKHDKDYEGHLKFNEDDEKVISLDKGEKADVVIPGYYINKPFFEFDSSKGVYNRYQYRKEIGEEGYTAVKQFDQYSGDTLEYNNIILQYCDFDVYLDYENDNVPTHYWNIDVLSGGKGKFITNGKAIDITWKKNSEFGGTHYYDMNGDEITLNQGKTWICIIDNDELDRVEISSLNQASVNSKTMND